MKSHPHEVTVSLEPFLPALLVNFLPSASFIFNSYLIEMPFPFADLWRYIETIPSSSSVALLSPEYNFNHH